MNNIVSRFVHLGTTVVSGIRETDDKKTCFQVFPPSENMAIENSFHG